MRLSNPRQTEINRLRSQLETNDFPRLKMLLIVGDVIHHSRQAHAKHD